MTVIELIRLVKLVTDTSDTHLISVLGMICKGETTQFGDFKGLGGLQSTKRE